MAGLARQNWPHDPQELDSTYGRPASANDAAWKAANLVGVTVPWTGKSVLFHKKAAPALAQILAYYWNEIGHDQSVIAHYGLADVETYNYRKNRNNASKLSNHSYGIAVDLAPSLNPNGTHWVDGGRMMPRRLIEIFKFVGARWGGDFGTTSSGAEHGIKDPMHFEFVNSQHGDQQPVPAPASLEAQAGGGQVIIPPSPPTTLPSAPGLPPLMQLGEQAVALVVRGLLAGDPAAAQKAADLRSQLVFGRDLATAAIALLDKVAPQGTTAPAPGPPIPPWLPRPAPAPAPAPALPTTTALLHVSGKCSWFGGPDDHGVKPSEGLAFISRYDQAPNLFLAQQPPGTTGLARRLNPAVNYLACRWNYAVTPKTMLLNQCVQALVRANGREALAHPADWGPNQNTGRAVDVSPAVMTALGVTTDDQVEVVYPAPTQGPTTMSMPSTQPTPDQTATVAAPVATGLSGSKINWTAGVKGLASAILLCNAVFGWHLVPLSPEAQVGLVALANTILDPAIVVMRTWFTTKILPQSLPPQARQQLGV